MEKVKTYGMAQVVINSQSKESLGRAKSAGKVSDRALEKELSSLAEENGLMVNFQTKSVTKKGAAQKQKYGSVQSTTTSKNRIMYAYMAK